MIRRWYESFIESHIRRVVAPHPGWICGLGLILTLLSAWTVVSEWNIDSSLMSLLPENAPAKRAHEEVDRRVGSSSSLFVVVDSPDTDANLDFARDYAEKLSELPEVVMAHFHNDPTFFKNHLLLYLEEKQLQDLYERLDEKLREKKKEANPLFVSLDKKEDSEESGGGGSGETKSIGEEIEERMKNLKFTDFKEYLVSDDGYSVTIIVRFDAASTDMKRTNQLMKKVRQVGQQLDPSSYHPEMKIQFGGGLEKRQDEYSSIVQDVRISALFTVLGLFFLIAFYFRRIRATFLVLTPIVTSAIWTLALAFLAFGDLNVITVFIFAIILGLGIDYSIHLLSSFDEYIHRSGDPVEALVGSYTETGRATLLGIATTFSAFTVLTFAELRGLSQFGIVSSIGIVCTMVATYVLLPALILSFDRLATTDGRFETVELFSSVTSLDDRTDTEAEGNGLVVALGTAAAVLTVGALVLAPYNAFEQNFGDIGELDPFWRPYLQEWTEAPLADERSQARSAAKPVAKDIVDRATSVRKALEPDTFRARREQTTVGEKYTSAVSSQISSVPSVLLFDSAEEARKVYNTMERMLEKGQLDTVRTVNAVYGFVPRSRKVQKERMDEIRKLRKLLEGEDLSVLKGETREKVDLLKRSLDVSGPIEIYDLPDWPKRFYREGGPQAKPPHEGEEFAFEYLIMVPSKVGLQKGPNARRFLRQLKSVEKKTGVDFRIASSASIYVALLDTITKRGPRLMGIALLLVFLIVVGAFVSLRQGLVALAPLVVGLIWMLGVVPLMGLRFDFFNVIILPVVIGIGIDDGIHFYSRYLELGRGQIRATLKTVGTTIVMTSLTSCVGFGGLALADYSGVRSIGYLAIAGIMSMLVATLIAVPLVLRLAERFGWESILPED